MDSEIGDGSITLTLVVRVRVKIPAPTGSDQERPKVIPPTARRTDHADICFLKKSSPNRRTTQGCHWVPHWSRSMGWTWQESNEFHPIGCKAFHDFVFPFSITGDAVFPFSVIHWMITANSVREELADLV
jgi:hypothetical protein